MIAPCSAIDCFIQIDDGEELNYSFDFKSRPLATGESLTSILSSVVTTDTPDADDTLTASSVSVSGTAILFKLAGQVAGAIYLLKVRVNTATEGGSNQVRAARIQVQCN